MVIDIILVPDVALGVKPLFMSMLGDTIGLAMETLPSMLTVHRAVIEITDVQDVVLKVQIIVTKVLGDMHG